ncbi:MAG: sirohydrochlorin chelatase [Pirellulales bacterium]|nr:sirohydrochlorin chelatase [Pirellulales bacterium]
MAASISDTHAPAGDAILVIGHGTREPQGIAQLHQFVDQLRDALAPRLVAPAFLEFAQPTIPEAIDTLTGAGATRVVAAPLLLFAAGHALRDIPELLADAERTHSRIEFRQARCLECHPAVVELSALRYREALAAADRSGADDRDTLLLFVGRGSREPEANAEMFRFARLRFEATPVAWLEVCFTALAEPSLERGLEIAAALPFGRVVVQPHLLFDGQLRQRIEHGVAATRRSCPQKEWIVTEILGPHRLLLEAVRELAATAASR